MLFLIAICAALSTLLIALTCVCALSVNFKLDRVLVALKARKETK